ncbi:MAG TPA: hypothetical protein VLR88_11510, partial [Propionibacteriaceae bacterium]|nr:hypothetical protein [Propionibacteriaceae bacterium]
MAYDATTGDPVSVTDPLAHSTIFGYDEAPSPPGRGLRTSVTDALGHVTRTVYEGRGRVKKVINHDNTFTEFGYDAAGRRSTVTDPLQRVTRYLYDRYGRLETVVDPMNQATRYSYDLMGNLLTLTDAKTQTPAFEYDLHDRVKKTIYPGGAYETFTYDSRGRLETMVDRKGTTTTYAYDDLGRLTGKTFSDATPAFSYTYDPAGRMLTAANGTDRLTNLAATHVPTSTPITNFGYQYDAAGNRTQKSTLDYTEDYGYDPLYRLTRTDRTNPGATPPNQWTWNYDAVGNRTSAQKDSEATTSSYNEKNQLTGATGGGKMLWRGTLDEPGTVNFSAATINGQPARMLAGNVFEATLDLPTGANNVTIQAQDGSGNIATKVYSVNVIGVPSTHTYDANGNLAAKTEGADSWTYTWNALNQLTAVSKNAVTQATYSYDPLGRRVEKLAGGTTTGWTHAGEDILRQTATAVAVSTTTRFIHGPGVDEAMAQEDAPTGALTYLHVDGLGSVVRHTDAAGVT